MPLGIGMGMLAGAGQGLLDTQKLQQSQAEAQIRNLLLRRQLQKDQATEEADKYGSSLTGLFGTPGLAAPTPVGGAAPSSPALDLFGGGGPSGGGGTTGTSSIKLTGQRPADTGYGGFPTPGANVNFPALSPNMTGWSPTSGPGYSAVTSPIDPSAYSGSQFHPERTRFVPGPNDRASQFSAPRIGTAPTAAAAAPTVQAPAEPASQPDGGLPDTVLPPDAGSGSSMPPRDAAATGRPSVTPASYTPGAGDDAAPQQPGATRPGETRVAAELTVDPQTYARQGLQDLQAKINGLPISPQAKHLLWQQKLKEAQPILQEYNRMWQQQESQKGIEKRQDRTFQQQNEMLAKRERDAAARAEAAAATAAKRAESQNVELFRKPDGDLEWLKKGSPVPKGWKPESEAGRAGSASIGREQDVEARIKQLDERFKKDNPKATPDEVADAHWKNRQDAEHGMATSKAAPARNLPMAITQKYIETHPNATHTDLINLAGAVRREQSIQTAFAGGDAGKNLRSLNTLADHVTLAREYGDALRNNDIPRANAVLNRWSIETGNPEVNDYNVARTIMADEVVRLLTSTGGTESDRAGMQGLFSENASPEQIAGAFNVATRFIKSRLDGLQQQYTRNDPDKIKEFQSDMLSAGSRNVFLTQVPTARETQKPIIREGQAAPGGATPAGPKPGDVEAGHRFKGGDPANPDNWETVQ
jgi:hypothetical protein